MTLLTESDHGLYCPRGRFYVDPWQPVERAVVTHAHADHARPGSQAYLAAKAGEHILRTRLPDVASFQFVEYGSTVSMNGVNVSLHPAGHMTGSAQVRMEYRGEVLVVTGDYKRQADPTCAAFEPIKCHTFVTESTFGLPIYRWNNPQAVFDDINQWWRTNQQAGRTSVLFTYAVGKSQRILSGIDTSIGPVFAHGAILKANAAYRRCGVELPEAGNVLEQDKTFDWSRTLVLAPPSARGSTWLRRFGNVSMAMASGWMGVRGIRRRRVVDRGFVISDHVDWPDLMQTIKETEAENVWVTHGYSAQVARHLQQQGVAAKVIKTEFRGEVEEAESP